jgi:hypothetical protein
MSAGRRERTTYFRKPECKYFCAEDWTVESALELLANFDFSRTRFCGVVSLVRDERSRNALIRPDGNKPGRDVRFGSTRATSNFNLAQLVSTSPTRAP